MQTTTTPTTTPTADQVIEARRIMDRATEANAPDIYEKASEYARLAWLYYQAHNRIPA